MNFNKHLILSLVVIVSLGLAQGAFADEYIDWNDPTDGELSYTGGKVGIGTTSPGTKLELYDSAVARFSINSGGNNSGFMFMESGVKKYSVASYDGGQFTVWDEVSSVSRFHILPNGNVGIGTTDPGDALKLMETS